MAADDTDFYMQIYNALRSRYMNYEEMFSVAISKLSCEVKFSSVKSCLMFGPGEGDHEVQFIKQCAADVNKLIAVEPDSKSLRCLEARLANSLPDVDSQVIETTIQNWKGLDDQDQVDLVLMMQVLYFVSPTERKELFKTLQDQWLITGGSVVVMSASHTKCPGNTNELFERLGNPILAWEDIEADLLEAGFTKQHAHDIQCTLDFSDL